MIQSVLGEVTILKHYIAIHLFFDAGEVWKDISEKSWDTNFLVDWTKYFCVAFPQDNNGKSVQVSLWWKISNAQIKKWERTYSKLME